MKSVFSAALVLLASLTCLQASVNSKHPNIVFVICDSMDGRVVDPTSSVYNAVQTPNLDRLAESGVNFVNNYCPSPQCVPSRSAMFAGRHVHKIQTWNNAQGLCVKWNDTDPAHCIDQGNNSYWKTFDGQFEKAGYEVNLYGKVDVGGGIGGGFHGSSGSTYAALTAWTRAANITHPQKTDPRTLVHDDAKNPFESDAKTIQKCVDWLNENGKDPKKPFFLYCGINIPHPAYSTNSTWLAMVNESAVTVPKWLPFEEMHPADQYEAASKALHYGGMKAFSKDDILSVRRSYYAMCAQTDHFMGQVVDAIKAVGRQDDTYVLFTSDHGEGNMEHMQTWKNSMYDANNKVPLIVSGPGVVRGKLVTNATSNIDLYPTMMNWAGLTVPDGLDLDGHSLSPFLVPNSSSTSSRPDFIFGEYHSNMANTGHFMIKRGNYKYIAFGQTPPYQGYKPQLFNLATDPQELEDISEKAPDIAAEMAKLMSSVADIQSIDKECKEQDKERFKVWFQNNKSDWVKVLGKVAYFGPNTTPFGDKEDLEKMNSWINGTEI
eukprot:m.2138 g.2138  ORF g.2138 m.2138 type:complete len:547 (+) comp8343_c0_seq1:29-1669(+)